LTLKKIKLYSGSRRTARATAAISHGNGRVRINKIPVELFSPEVAKERVLLPLRLAGELRNKVNIDIDVKGGGFMGRAEAAAISLSRALVDFTGNADLKTKITEYDKHLLVGDPRRKESKKFGGPGARVRKQKSYR
jgi:small subunit ribosomal protein S9